MIKNTLYKVSLALWLCFLTVTVFAAPTTEQLNTARDKSLAYLVQQQNGDGSWGSTQSEKVRLTATVLDTFKKYNVSGLVYNRGLSWLANAEANTADSLARLITMLAGTGISD